VRPRVDDRPCPSEPPRVLWIDDQPNVLIAHLKYLREIGGCAVDVAEDGARGLDASRRREYDVIIVDWLLPGMSGGQVLAALRAEGCHAPVIVLTGHGSEDIAFACGQLGAVTYVAKPIQPGPFLEIVRKYGQRAAPSAFASPVCEFLSGAIIQATTLARDPRTFAIWGRLPGVTEDEIHRHCALLNVKGRNALTFARLLRAVLLVETAGVQFEEVLDVADPKTLRRLLARGGLSPDQTPSSVTAPEFLKTQVLITHPRLLGWVTRLLRERGVG
jgi:DNA-binding response OmpR family regulator